jgi:NAD(P)-dependent dehydrogenase (short-subunit alcohol dehydrogenase family)
MATIRVNAWAPFELSRVFAERVGRGHIVSLLDSRIIDVDWTHVEKRTGTVPLKRHGMPEQIADAVVFLCQSDFITGQVIFVDGGRHLAEYKQHG